VPWATFADRAETSITSGSLTRTYGRDRRDDCLRRIVAAILGALFRPADLAAQWGSGEFTVLLSATNQARAAVVGERLRSRVLELAMAHAGSNVGPHVAMSLGVDGLTPCADLPVDDVVATAERALSQAKLRGVVCQEHRDRWLP